MASWVRQSYGILDVGHIVRIKVMVMDREKAGRLERMIVSLQSVGWGLLNPAPHKVVIPPLQPRENSQHLRSGMKRLKVFPVPGYDR